MGTYLFWCAIDNCSPRQERATVSVTESEFLGQIAGEAESSSRQMQTGNLVHRVGLIEGAADPKGDGQAAGFQDIKTQAS